MTISAIFTGKNDPSITRSFYVRNTALAAIFWQFIVGWLKAIFHVDISQFEFCNIGFMTAVVD
jgi:hypothetical protein